MVLVYKSDIGAIITISTSNTVIPSGTTLTVLIKKPSGTILTKTPSVDLTTGVLTYDTIAGDLDETGEYRVQVHGVFQDGDDLYSDRDSFAVYDKLT